MVASGSSDMKRRKSLAFWRLEQLWKSPHIPIATKGKLFNDLCHYYYSMAVNHGWSPRTLKTKSPPLLPHATDSCWIWCTLTIFWTLPSIPWLTLFPWFTWLGNASWNILVTSSECQRKSLLEDMLCTSQPLAKGDLVDHVLHILPVYKDCLGIMKEQCKNSRLPHLLIIVVHGEPCSRLLRSRWMMMMNPGFSGKIQVFLIIARERAIVGR